jgi:hypothetical protein
MTFLISILISANYGYGSGLSAMLIFGDLEPEQKHNKKTEVEVKIYR